MSYPTVPLGKLVTSLRNGLSPSSKGEVPGEVLTLSAVTQGRYDDDYSKEATFDRPPADDQIARPGMLLICRGNGNINLVGAGVIVPDGARKVVFPDTVIGAQLDCDAIDAHYLRHAWASRAIRSQVEASARTTNGTHKVNQKSLGAIDVPVPPLDEQRRIAAILDKADAIQRKRREAIAMTEELLRSTFLEMFGDPVTNPKGFPTRLVSEFYASAAEGTKCRPFGSALKKSEYVESGVPVWNMDNISRNGSMSPPFRMWITEEKYRQLESYAVQDGDVLISRAGTVGKMCVAASAGKKSIISTNLIRVRFGPHLLPIYFVSLMTHCKGRVGRLRTGADGAFTHMNTGILDKLKFPYPPPALQQRFAAFVESVRAQEARQRRAISTSDDLFHSLLQRAFAGEL